MFCHMLYIYIEIEHISAIGECVLLRSLNTWGITIRYDNNLYVKVKPYNDNNDKS